MFQAQQKNMKLMIDELSSVQKQNAESQQERMSAIAARGQQENNVIQQLKAIVAEKESKVKTLEQELTQLKHMVRVISPLIPQYTIGQQNK